LFGESDAQQAFSIAENAAELAHQVVDNYAQASDDDPTTLREGET